MQCGRTQCRLRVCATPVALPVSLSSSSPSSTHRTTESMRLLLVSGSDGGSMAGTAETALSWHAKSTVKKSIIVSAQKHFAKASFIKRLPELDSLKDMLRMEQACAAEQGVTAVH